MPKNINDILNLDILRYRESNSETEHNALGMGALDVTQVLKGKTKMFRQSTQGKVDYHNKCLVICDPTEVKWTDQKIKDVGACLEVLLDAQYEILVLNGEGISLERLKKAKDYHYAALKNPVASFGLSTDGLIKKDRRLKDRPTSQIGLLNTFAIDTMLGTAFDEYEVPTSFELDIAIAGSLEGIGIPLGMIHDTMNKSHPLGVHWLLRRALLDDLLAFEKMMEIAPHQCTIRLNEIYIREEMIDESRISKLGQIQYDPFNVKFDIQDQELSKIVQDQLDKVIPHTKNIGLNFVGIDFKIFDVDFSKIPAISTAVIHSLCHNVDIFFHKIDHTLPTLQNLYFELNSDLTSELLLSILSKTKMLKGLNVRDHSQGTLRIDKPFTLNVPHLSKVDFERSTLDIYWLSALITPTSNIKEINLQYATIYDTKHQKIGDIGTLKLGEDQLPLVLSEYYNRNLKHKSSFLDKAALEIIDLSNVEVSEQGFQSLLREALHIKKLNILSQSTENITLNENTRYESLVDLKMTGDAGEIENMVKRAPMIEHLTIHLNNSYTLTKDTKAYLSSLRSLDIRSCQTLRPLVQILDSAKTLDSVEINVTDSQDGFLVDDRDADSNSLNESRSFKIREYIRKNEEKLESSPVRSLTITAPRPGAKEIPILFNLMKKITFLTINYVGEDMVNRKKYNDHIHLWGTLDNIEYYKIDSREDVMLQNDLYDYMPKLKEFHIHSNTNIYGEDYTPEITLPIETLSITGKGIAMLDAIEKLLYISPHLKNLQVNCRSQHSDFLFDITELEVLDISEGNFLNAESLYELLLKNPNIRVLRIKNRPDLANFILPEGLKKLEVVDIRGVYYDQAHFMLLASQVKGNIIRTVDNTLLDITPSDQHMGQDNNTGGANDLGKDSSNSIDMDTTLKNTTFNVTHYFVDVDGNKPSPALYRESVSNDVIFKEGIFTRTGSPFIVTNRGQPEFRDCPEVTLKDNGVEDFFYSSAKALPGKHFLGKKSLLLTSTPQRLPSLHANEVMTQFSIPGLKKEDYIIKRSDRDDFYYISSANGTSKQVMVEFILKTPESIDLIADPVYTSDTVPQELPPEYEEGTAAYWRDVLCETKAGRCEHKALSYFFNNLESNLQLRIASNTAHTYIEEKLPEDQLWTKKHLGGHPANLVFSKDEFSNKSASIPPAGRTLDLNPAFLDNDASEKDLRPPKDYIFDMLSRYAGHNVLVNIKSSESLESFQQLARETAQHISRPVFYIDSPDDISCHAPRMMRDNHNNGILVETPGGPLYDFLHANHEQSPVIIVNFSRFSAEETVRFNSLIDKNRSADREAIPKRAAVIGLYNDHLPDAYRGTDFTSRFDVKLKPEFTAQTLNACLEPKQTAPDDLILPSVYLHQSLDWQSLLFGRWHLSSTGWSYEEGPLIHALETGQGLTLHDAPWDDRDFQNFMTRMRINKTIEIAGKIYPVPSGFFINEGPPYRLDEHAAERVQLLMIDDDALLPADALVLNPVTFSQFFQQYHVQDGMLCSREGYVSACKGGETLSLYLSHELSGADWGRLVEAAADKNVILKVYTQSGIRLPRAIGQCIQGEGIKQSPAFDHSPLALIKTNDVHTTIKEAEDTLGSPLIIDCTGLQPADLFGSITQATHSTLMNFVQTDSVIDNTLAQGKHVMLTGHLSPELEQYLAHWAMTKKHDNASLHLVTEKSIPSLEYVSHYTENILKNPVRLKNVALTENDYADNFIVERSELIKTALALRPIVLITGPTGVGKSTFMLDHFSKDVEIELHNGLDSIETWLTSLTQGKAITLFIDEANIAEDKKQDWAEFAALLLNESSPTILWKGKVYPLTYRHKVVFAGNPHTYGGERYQPSLFKDYPIAQVEFKPINTPSLVSSVIQPALGGLPEYEAINTIFVHVYNLILHLSTTDALITPRELKHMAHLYLIYAKYHRGKPEDLATLCANTVAKQLLPESMHDRLPSADGLLSMPTEDAMVGYCVTESRKPIESRLNEFLAIRDLKISDKNITGGLGGIILQGDPGTGKSEHVVAQLVAQGFEEGSNGWREDKRFYRMPVSMGYAEKKTLLFQAYQQGAIVVVDEINTSPAMERFFNDALSGTLELPANMHQTDIKPGFMLIGTQNPFSLEGRRKMSRAMERRLMHCEMPQYGRDEMVQVLVEAHNVNTHLAQQIVADFEQANQARTTPLPFRVLLKQYREAVPFIVKTYAHRSEFMPVNERMAFIQSLLVAPLPPQKGESGSTDRVLFVDRSPTTPITKVQSNPPRTDYGL